MTLSRTWAFASGLLALTLAGGVVDSGCGLEAGGLDVEPSDAGGIFGGEDATIAPLDGTIASGDDTGVGLGSDSDAPPVVVDASDAADTSPPPILEAGTDACGPVEICNNGIDDNCNGKIDCADPACGPASWQCTAQEVPQGWTVVEYAAGPTTPACGTGYATSSSVYEGPFAPAQCSCECAVGTSGSCESGNISALFGSSTQACAGMPVPAPAGGGACEAIVQPGYTPAPGAKEEITAAPYAAGTCQATSATTRPPIPENGHMCTETTPAGAGCPNSGACVPATQAGFALCIEQPIGLTTPTCPAGFTSVHDVGGGVTEGRDCTACTCTGPTAQCANAAVNLFTDPACGSDGGTANIVVNGQCNPVTMGPSVGAAPTFHAYQYEATLSGEACAGSGSSTPTGGVTLTGAMVVCCQ